MTTKVQLKVYIDADLAAAVRKRLNDPLYNKVKKGTLSTILESLLWDWVKNNPIPGAKK